MRVKLDENLPHELAADLRSAGCDAETVFEEGLTGVKDPVLVQKALSEDRILFTLDKGVGNLQDYPADSHAGVVLFRSTRSGRGAVLTFIRDRLPDLLALDLRGRLTVVSATRIRTRQ